MERDRSSNVATALLALLTLASALYVAEANVFTGKSFLKAQQDCVNFLGINPLRMGQYKKHLYPGDRETMCLIRCICITLDIWDDTHGFNVNMVEQQFSPLVNATFKKKLNDTIALKLALLDPLDNCARAFYAFRTFRQLLRQLLNFGTNTNATNVNFEPLEPETILTIIVDCAREVNLPGVLLANLAKGNIVDCAEVHCLIRCAAIRSRFYTDQDGALLANLHRQFNNSGEDLESFTLRHKMCLERHQQPATSDKCTRAFKQFLACMRPDFEQYFIRHKSKILQHAIFKSEPLLEGQSSLMLQPQQPTALDQLGEMSGNMDLLLGC